MLATRKKRRTDSGTPQHSALRWEASEQGGCVEVEKEMRDEESWGVVGGGG